MKNDLPYISIEFVLKLNERFRYKGKKLDISLFMAFCDNLSCITDELILINL